MVIWKKYETSFQNTIKLFPKFLSQIWSFTTFSFWAQIVAAFKKKWLQFPCYVTDILRKSFFEMRHEKLKNIHYSKSYWKFKKASNFCFFVNIFVNNGLKHFVLGSINSEFCCLPFYFKAKIHFSIKHIFT